MVLLLCTAPLRLFYVNDLLMSTWSQLTSACYSKMSSWSFSADIMKAKWVWTILTNKHQSAFHNPIKSWWMNSLILLEFVLEFWCFSRLWSWPTHCNDGGYERVTHTHGEVCSHSCLQCPTADFTSAWVCVLTPLTQTICPLMCLRVCLHTSVVSSCKPIRITCNVQYALNVLNANWLKMHNLFAELNMQHTVTT